MKLSELIAFRNRLEELPVSAAKQAADYKLDILMHTVNYPLEDSMSQLTQPFMPALEDKLKEIHEAFEQFTLGIDQVKKHVRSQIEEKEKYWFQESYKLFESAEDCEKTDQILYGRAVSGAKSQLTIDAEDTLRARLSTYADWRWPGMIIRPGLEDFIENMVGCDPLYIIDREHDLLRPCLNRFPKLYQNRLRSYTTNDWSDQPILDKIPNNQFGVCLASNVFNYRPLEIIRRYLEEIYQKLRPGGVLLMTYNDCDRAGAVMLVEQFCASYTPGYLIRDLTQNIGFEQLHTWSDEGPSVWLELRKPGKVFSNRGGQVISKIKEVEDYLQDVDFLRRKVYNEKELISLQEEANKLNIEQTIIDNLCNTCPYDLQILINNINEKTRRALEEKENFDRLTQLAIEYNINIKDEDWKELLINAQNKALAIENAVDINLPGWEETLKIVLAKKEEERAWQAEENRKIADALEKKRIEMLHQQARLYNINPLLYENEEEIHRLIAEAIDQRKKEELVKLRQRAMELQAGDTNLIRYGYSAEKLKELIKQKEEENK